jgi:hypothetical protein
VAQRTAEVYNDCGFDLPVQLRIEASLSLAGYDNPKGEIVADFKDPD